MKPEMLVLEVTATESLQEVSGAQTSSVRRSKTFPPTALLIIKPCVTAKIQSLQKRRKMIVQNGADVRVIKYICEPELEADT